MMSDQNQVLLRSMTYSRRAWLLYSFVIAENTSLIQGEQALREWSLEHPDVDLEEPLTAAQFMAEREWSSPRPDREEDQAAQYQDLSD